MNQNSESKQEKTYCDRYCGVGKYNASFVCLQACEYSCSEFCEHFPSANPITEWMGVPTDGAVDAGTQQRGTSDQRPGNIHTQKGKGKGLRERKADQRLRRHLFLTTSIP